MRSAINSLLDPLLPTGKSVIVEDKDATRTTKLSEVPAMSDKSISDTKKRSPVLVFVLVKIMKNSLKKVLNEVRYYIPPPLYLPLMQKKQRTTKNQVFISLFIHYQQLQYMEKGQKVEISSRMEALTFIFKSIIKKNIKIGFRNMTESLKKQRAKEQFLLLLQKRVNELEKKADLQGSFFKFKRAYLQANRDQIRINKICHSAQGFQYRIKEKAFQRIIDFISFNQNEDTKRLRQQLSEKTTHRNGERYKMIVEQRQRFKQTKMGFDYSSSQKNKSKTDWKREIIILQNKVAEEQKKNGKIITHLLSDIQKKKQNLLQMTKTLQQRRKNQKNAESMQNHTLQIYDLLLNTPTNNNRILLPKQLSTQLNQVQKLDEYLIHLNNKLRREIILFENRQDAPEDLDSNAYRENQAMKGLIQITIEKYFSDYISLSCQQ